MIIFQNTSVRNRKRKEKKVSSQEAASVDYLSRLKVRFFEFDLLL